MNASLHMKVYSIEARSIEARIIPFVTCKECAQSDSGTNFTIQIYYMTINYSMNCGIQFEKLFPKTPMTNHKTNTKYYTGQIDLRGYRIMWYIMLNVTQKDLFLYISFCFSQCK